MRKIFFLLLGVILIAGCGSESNRFDKHEQAAVEKHEGAGAPAAVSGEKKPESPESIKNKVKGRLLPADRFGKNDPFAYGGGAAYGEKAVVPKKAGGRGQESGFQLDGIIWDDREPMAVINGTAVKEGDKIGDKTVGKIGKDSVTLFDGRARITLRL